MRQPVWIVSSLVIALVVTLSGCTNTTVTAYGADLKTNFVNGCTVDRTIVDKKLATADLASKTFCTCVYDRIDPTNTKTKTYSLSFDDLKAYEDKVSSAKAGQQPAVPDKLRKAYDDCTKLSAGPVPGG